MSTRLKNDWKAVGKSAASKKLADWMNAISNQFNFATVPSGGTARPTASGFQIEVDGGASFPWALLAFGYTLAFDAETAVTTCTIYEGTVRLHGLGVATLPSAENEIVLEGEPCWVFVSYARSATQPSWLSLQIASSEPVSTSSTVRIPLYRFDAGAPGQYTLGRICNMGDINFDTPIR